MGLDELSVSPSMVLPLHKIIREMDECAIPLTIGTPRGFDKYQWDRTLVYECMPAGHTPADMKRFYK